MNINVLGWYNHGNVGDEAFKLAFPKVLRGHNLSFIERLSEPDPDMVILGGGDVLYPAFTKHLKEKSHIRQRAMSVSLMTNSDLTYIDKFEKVFVRDYRSLEVAKNYNPVLPREKVTYLPDFTFALTPDRVMGRSLLRKMFAAEGHELYEKVVVCVVSAYVAFTGPEALGRDLTTFLNVSQNIATVADRTPASFVFLPFSTKAPWDDKMPNAWVASRCKFYKKNLAVWQKLGVQDTLNIVAAADAVVSSRLHSTVFSTIAGVPFIDVTHHAKNKGFVETVEKTEWSVPLWDFSISRFENLIKQFIASPFPDPKLTDFTTRARGQLRDAALL